MLFFNSMTSEKYKIHDLNGLYVTTAMVVYWIDILTRPALKHLIVDSLRYCQNINATQDKEASVKKIIGRTPLQILGRRITSA
jgi:hypothetical protein